MSIKSKIEWTDATWNPVRGCTIISSGCENCYAQTFAERFRGVPNHPYEQGFDLRLVPEKIAEPLRWASPRMIFVNSMSDLFHEKVPDCFIERVVETMHLADWHTYQVLTKRSVRMMEMLNHRLKTYQDNQHILWGVSVEDKKHGLPRVEHLRSIPKVTKFLSIEPLLEDLGEINLKGISWVIVGGESGPNARPMQIDWVLSIKEQCRSANIPFFFKQWGGVQKKKNGRMLNGRTYNEFPIVTMNEPAPLETRLGWIEQLESI